MQLQEWSSGIGKHLLKVEDGKSVVGVFRGEPVRFYQHWKGRSVVCSGRDTCTLCASQDPEERKASGRFRFNFIVQGAQPVAMIFESGKRVYEQLLQLNKKVPLEKAWVEITRTGTKKNTQFFISILPGNAGMLTPDQEKEILKVKLHDLALNKPEDEDDANEDAPF